MTQGTAVAKRPVAGKAKPPAVVAAISEARLELLERHRAELDLGWEYDDYDDSGELIARRWPVGRVNEYTKLLPEKTCRALIAELDAALAPALYDQARALAMTVMGRYTKRELYDFDIFLFEMTRVFGEAPADLGRQACDQLRTKVFLVNAPDVKIILADLVQEREDARTQARRHLAERERRRAEAAKPEPDVVTPEQVAAILERGGHRAMVAEMEAEKKRPKTRAPIHQRAHDAAMEQFRKDHPEAVSPTDEQDAEAVDA